MHLSERINVSFHGSPPSRSPLKTVYPMPRPPLDPLTNVGHCPSSRPPATVTCSETSSSRRQSSISYLPPDSPRLWSPRTPLAVLSALERSSSLSGANSPKGEGHSRTRSVPQRAISEPAVLTLAERYADLLQFIAQKESKCLELRSQLAIHESELLELKRKWERIVRREFGRNIPSTLTPASPAPSAVLNGLVGGVRALAAATTSPPLTPSMSRVRSSSLAVANHEPSQAPSNSVSSTTTSSSIPSTAGSPRLSQSSISSVAEVKTDSGKVEGQREGAIAQDSGDMDRSKVLRRRSRDSQAPLADALKALTGEGSGKRASAASPTSLSAMGLGRANLGEAAQGWVDTVGSKFAELQRGETFSKSQKRASLIFSDVSQSIFSALTPASTVNVAPACAPPAQSLLDEEDDAGSTALGRALLPDIVAISEPPTSLQTSTREGKDEEEDESWNW